MTPEQSKIIKIFFIPTLIIIIAGFIVWKMGILEPDFSTSSLVSDPASFDIGTVSMKNGNVDNIIDILNEGDKPVTITDISTSCMCTTVAFEGATFGMHGSSRAGFTVKPGEKKEMTVTFDPNAHGPEGTGPISRVISVRTNSVKTPVLEIRFSGNVIK